MNQDLQTQLNALVLFYAQNIGAISQALWLEQDALNLSNRDVVEIIESLAVAKERIQDIVDGIKGKLRGDLNDPEA